MAKKKAAVEQALERWLVDVEFESFGKENASSFVVYARSAADAESLVIEHLRRTRGSGKGTATARKAEPLG